MKNEEKPDFDQNEVNSFQETLTEKPVELILR